MRSAARTRILIVEDDKSTQWLLGKFLQKSFSGFDVLYADSALEGKRLLEINQVDIVICDYNMSGGLGTEVLEYLRDAKSDLPFILYSSEELQRIPHVSYLKFTYVQKPNIDILMVEISRQLQK